MLTIPSLYKEPIYFFKTKHFSTILFSLCMLAKRTVSMVLLRDMLFKEVLKDETGAKSVRWNVLDGIQCVLMKIKMLLTSIFCFDHVLFPPIPKSVMKIAGAASSPPAADEVEKHYRTLILPLCVYGQITAIPCGHYNSHNV